MHLFGKRIRAQTAASCPHCHALQVTNLAHLDGNGNRNCGICDKKGLETLPEGSF